MLLRAVLEFVLILLVVRAFWRLVGGVMQGISNRSRDTRRPDTRTPVQGVPMVRDPVCGTFVVPDRALVVSDGRQRVYFCSSACRDAYRARSSGAPATGRTA